MTYALNEVEAMAKKATRGAGYPWGLSEEAGKAVRWLCSRGLDGCAALSAVLNAFEGSALADRVPVQEGAYLRATGPVLCPLFAGAVVSDQAGAVAQGEVRLGAVVQPILLVPFAAMVSRSVKVPVGLWSDGFAIMTDGTHVSIDGNVSAEASSVVFRHTEADVPVSHLFWRAAPKSADWDILGKFAHRTYAPATEESRRKGAGADTALDNT